MLSTKLRLSRITGAGRPAAPGDEARGGRGLAPLTYLMLKCASASRPSGDWNDDEIALYPEKISFHQINKKWDASDIAKGLPSWPRRVPRDRAPKSSRPSRSKMRPFPADLMRMWLISSPVNKPENDDPSIVEPIEAATSA